MKILWYKSSQVKSSQVVLSRCYFETLREACELVGIYNINFCEKVLLKNITQYSNEKIEANTLNSFNYVGVENLLQDRLGKCDSKYVPTKGKANLYKKNDILIGNIRPYLRKIWMANIDGGSSGDVLVISIKENFISKVLPKYLFYVLSDEKFFNYNIKNSRGAKMPRGDKKKIMEYELFLPPLPVQEQVVKILDKFETLTNDINEGLPKEIELRQKQYEYYREKLLDFKK